MCCSKKLIVQQVASIYVIQLKFIGRKDTSYWKKRIYAAAQSSSMYKKAQRVGFRDCSVKNRAQILKQKCGF